MRGLSLICLFSLSLFSLSFALDIRDITDTRETAKLKCGDLDSAFWEYMHKYDLCELKKLPKRPQCGEGRKKCGLPGSHCDDGVCSTACGAGRPECPDGFICENGDCEESDEEKDRDKEKDKDKGKEHEKEKEKEHKKEKGKEKEKEHEKSPSSLDISPGATSSTAREDEGKVEKGSNKCIDEKTGCACTDEKCKEEECHHKDGACIDEPGQRRNQTVPSTMKSPQKPKTGGFFPMVMGISKHNNGTARSGLRKSSSRTRPQPVAMPINHPQSSRVTSDTEIPTERYGLCDARRQNVVCEMASETCVQRPQLECHPSDSRCMQSANESGICIGYVIFSTPVLFPSSTFSPSLDLCSPVEYVYSILTTQTELVTAFSAAPVHPVSTA